LCRCDVQRRRTCGNHSGLIVKTIPGQGEKLFAFPSEWPFTFSPESCSPSPRNGFHVHPGIAFTLPRIPHRDAEPGMTGVHTGEAIVTRPLEPAPLTSPQKGMPPRAAYLVTEAVQSQQVCRDCMVREVAIQDPLKPRAQRGARVRAAVGRACSRSLSSSLAYTSWLLTATTWNLPCWSVPQQCVKPRKSKVSGLPCHPPASS
jgi:hypothetical protein